MLLCRFGFCFIKPMIIIAATALPTTNQRIKFDFSVKVDVIFVELREVVSGDKSGFP